MPLRVPAVAAALFGAFIVIDETVHGREDLLSGLDRDGYGCDDDDHTTPKVSGSASTNQQQGGHRRRRSPTTNITHIISEYANGKNNKTLRRSSSSVLFTRSTARSAIVATAVTILIGLGLFSHFSIISMSFLTKSSLSNFNKRSFGSAAVRYHRHHHHLRTESNSQEHNPPPPPLPRQQRQPQQKPPKIRLHSDDIEIVRYVASGSINSVFECRITNDEWWTYQNSLPHQLFFDGSGRSNRTATDTLTDTTANEARSYSKFILKVGVDHFYGPQEDEAMKRIYEEERKAIELGFLPLVESWPNVTNPFLKDSWGDVDEEEDEDRNSKNDLQSSLRSIVQKLKQNNEDQDSINMLQRLLDPNNDRVYAVVVPDVSADKLGYVYQHQVLDTLPKIKLFMRSMLRQLQYAHAHGVNNMDLSGDRNVYVSKHNYQAILFDWNGWVRPGEVVYDPFWNQRLVPPEYWLETMEGKQVLMSSDILHAFDVWSVGYMLARLIYQPFCGWVDHLSYNNDSLARLQDTILTLGINRYDPTSGQLPQFWVPVGDGTNSRIDLTKAANLTKRDFDEVYEEMRGKNKLDFEPMLQGTKSTFFFTQCPEDTKFDVLVESTKDVENVLDLLRQMMTISPLERPNYDELLKHSFFEESAITDAGADAGVSSNQ